MFSKAQVGRVQAFGKVPACRKYELYMERYRSAAEIAQRILGENSPLTILDVGSGRGRLKYFFDKADRIQWHGIEVLDEMMRICSDLGYQMHKHDLERAPLPFKDAAFDVVAGLHVLEHLAQPGQVVRDMARVLRPGGLLILGVPTKPPLIGDLLARYYASRQARHPEEGRTCNAFSSTGFMRFLQMTLGDSCTFVDLRGFRVFSARRRLPLEDWHWFYRASTWFGKHCPSLTPEVNVVLQKRAD